MSDTTTSVPVKTNLSVLSHFSPTVIFWLGVTATVVAECIVGFFILLAMVIKGVSVVDNSVTVNSAVPVVANTNTVKTNTAKTNTAIAVDSAKVKTDNSAYIGKADAPVTIAYWTDYQCPFCQRNEQQTMPAVIKDYVDTGKAKIVYKDFAFLGADSNTIAQYARAVWETDPTKFLAWHQAMFNNQGTENSGWATTAKIEEITKTVFDDATTKKISALVVSKGSSYTQAMEDDKNEGYSMGVNGTPAFVIGKQFVNGAQSYTVIKAAIEAALQ